MIRRAGTAFYHCLKLGYLQPTYEQGQERRGYCAMGTLSFYLYAKSDPFTVCMCLVIEM